MKINPFVSIVIPARMSGENLARCLPTIKNQTYKNIETIIVDSNSSDNTKTLAKEYKCSLYSYIPLVKPGFFDAPHKRNFGATKAKGEFIYYVDADMELPPKTVEDAVCAAKKYNYDAVIIRQDSLGTSIWAKAKWLERRCYWEDNTVEAPRFIRRSAWNKLGGLDETLGAGGDDWDMYQKLLINNYSIGRIKSIIVINNEGNLSLKKLWEKRFMYGKDTLLYMKKRPLSAAKSYFPFRLSYIKNWKLFIMHPVLTCAFLIMRSFETIGMIAGMSYSFLVKND